MSTDYFLFSPSYKRCVMVGSVGLSGVKSWPTEYGGKDFIAWAIENGVIDVVLVSEHQVDAIGDDQIVDIVDISKYVMLEKAPEPI